MPIMMVFYCILGTVIFTYIVKQIVRKRKISKFSWLMLTLLFTSTVLNVADFALFLQANFETCMIKIRIIFSGIIVIMIDMSALLSFKYIKATRQIH